MAQNDKNVELLLKLMTLRSEECYTPPPLHVTVTPLSITFFRPPLHASTQLPKSANESVFLMGCFEGIVFNGRGWAIPCDIDGDGADEVVLAIWNNEDEQTETYVFKLIDGAMEQVFFHSTAGVNEGYRIPIQLTLPSYIDEDTWNASVIRVWLEEFPEGISIMMAHGLGAYSRIVWDGTQWTLLEQGKLEY